MADKTFPPFLAKLFVPKVLVIDCFCFFFFWFFYKLTAAVSF